MSTKDINKRIKAIKKRLEEIQEECFNDVGEPTSPSDYPEFIELMDEYGELSRILEERAEGQEVMDRAFRDTKRRSDPTKKEYY